MREVLAGTSSFSTADQSVSRAPIHLGVVMGILLGMSIAIELLDHFLTHKLHKYPHLLLTVHKAYKEIMILGIINMTAFVADMAGVFEFEINGTTFDHYAFEWVHIALFLIAFLYIFLVLFVILYLIRVTFKYWNRVDSVGLVNAETKFDRSVELLRGWRTLFYHRWVMKWNYEKRLFWHKIKRTFIQENDLDQTFSFARYMRKCMRRACMDILEIKVSVWLAFMACVVVNCIRMQITLTINPEPENAVKLKLTPNVNVFGNAGGFIAVGWIILLCAYGIYIQNFFLARQLANRVRGANRVNSLFLRKPAIMLFMIQTIIIYTSIYLTAIIMQKGEEFVTLYGGGPGAVLILLALLPMMLIIFVFLPVTLPLFVLVTSVGDLKNEELMRSSQKESRHAKGHGDDHQDKGHKDSHGHTEKHGYMADHNQNHNRQTADEKMRNAIYRLGGDSYTSAYTQESGSQWSSQSPSMQSTVSEPHAHKTVVLAHL